MTAVLESDLAVENPLVVGLERLPVHPTTLVIFGATGDLASRKLLPAIYNLAHEGALPERFELIGVSRTRACRTRITASSRARRSSASRGAGPTRTCSRACSPRLRYVPGTFDDDGVYAGLDGMLEELDGTRASR